MSVWRKGYCHSLRVDLLKPLPSPVRLPQIPEGSLRPALRSHVSRGGGATYPVGQIQLQSLPHSHAGKKLRFYPYVPSFLPLCPA